MPPRIGRGAPGGDSGLSLLELMVAVLILSIGIIAALRSVEQSGRVIGQEAARLAAHSVALNRAGELRLLGAERGRGLPGRVRQGQTEWQVDVAENAAQIGLVEVTITVSAPGSPGARVVSYVAQGPSWAR